MYINHQDKHGKTILLYACHNGNTQLIMQLLSKGADASLNSCDLGGVFTVIGYSQTKPLEDRVIASLIQAGADINQQEKAGGNTVAHIIIICINSFIDQSNKAQLNYSSKILLEKVIKFGADIFIKNYQNKSPLQLLLSKNFRDSDIVDIISHFFTSQIELSNDPIYTNNFKVLY
jgi:ankyrin repeat protein